jgi:hypothetical protein
VAEEKVKDVASGIVVKVTMFMKNKKRITGIFFGDNRTIYNAFIVKYFKQ